MTRDDTLGVLVTPQLKTKLPQLRPDCERYIKATTPLVLFTGSHHVSLSHPEPLVRLNRIPLQHIRPGRNLLQHTLVSPKPYINVSVQQR